MFLDNYNNNNNNHHFIPETPLLNILFAQRKSPSLLPSYPP